MLLADPALGKFHLCLIWWLQQWLFGAFGAHAKALSQNRGYSMWGEA